MLKSSLLCNNMSTMDNGPIYTAEIRKNLNITVHFNNSNNDDHNNGNESSELLEKIILEIYGSFAAKFTVLYVWVSQIYLDIFIQLLKSSYQNLFTPTAFY